MSESTAQFTQLQSAIPTPFADYGQSNIPVPLKVITYDGQTLPAFIQAKGGDPMAYREFLEINRIGDPFELSAGRSVVVPQYQSQFSIHRNCTVPHYLSS